MKGEDIVQGKDQIIEYIKCIQNMCIALPFFYIYQPIINSSSNPNLLLKRRLSLLESFLVGKEENVNKLLKLFSQRNNQANILCGTEGIGCNTATDLALLKYAEAFPSRTVKKLYLDEVDDEKLFERVCLKCFNKKIDDFVEGIGILENFCKRREDTTIVLYSRDTFAENKPISKALYSLFNIINGNLYNADEDIHIKQNQLIIIIRTRSLQFKYGLSLPTQSRFVGNIIHFINKAKEKDYENMLRLWLKGIEKCSMYEELLKSHLCTEAAIKAMTPGMFSARVKSILSNKICEMQSSKISFFQNSRISMLAVFERMDLGSKLTVLGILEFVRVTTEEKFSPIDIFSLIKQKRYLEFQYLSKSMVTYFKVFRSFYPSFYTLIQDRFLNKKKKALKDQFEVFEVFFEIDEFLEALKQVNIRYSEDELENKEVKIYEKKILTGIVCA
eukprot:snap_masked-scaffold_25-processed-gene-4.32-mRNA-1 protein AED:1.00 eAED:1.00 QI:0/-1/0/0/-1/1/1/0/444